MGLSSSAAASRLVRVALRATSIRLAAAALVLIAPGVAVAELSNDSLIGPGLRSRPAYDGSASQRTELVPVVRYFGERWFVRSTQGVLEGGLRVELAPGLHAGAQLAYEPGRLASESAFLANHAVEDIKRGASVGLHLEWDHSFGPVPITLLARARKLTDSDLGAQADLRLSVGVLHSGPVSLGVFTQGTWANAKSVECALRHHAAAIGHHRLARVRRRRREPVCQRRPVGVGGPEPALGAGRKPRSAAPARRRCQESPRRAWIESLDQRRHRLPPLKQAAGTAHEHTLNFQWIDGRRADGASRRARRRAGQSAERSQFPSWLYHRLRLRVLSQRRLVQRAKSSGSPARQVQVPER